MHTYIWGSNEHNIVFNAVIGENIAILEYKEDNNNSYICSRLDDHSLPLSIYSWRHYYLLNDDSKGINFDYDIIAKGAFAQYEYQGNNRTFVNSGQWWCTGDYLFLLADKIGAGEKDGFLMYCMNYNWSPPWGHGGTCHLTLIDPDDSFELSWSYYGVDE